MRQYAAVHGDAELTRLEKRLAGPSVNQLRL
jgi:hypothetical protein